MIVKLDEYENVLSSVPTVSVLLKRGKTKFGRVLMFLSDIFIQRYQLKCKILSDYIDHYSINCASRYKYENNDNNNNIWLVAA